jgi:mannose-6-phosphate isomerase-like protein (cupin superfamily)
MKLALLAMLPLVFSVPSQTTAPAPQTKAPPPQTKAPAPQTKAPRPRAAAPATPPATATTATITVTDLSGAPLDDVRVSLTGSLDRSGSTQPNGTVKFDGLRAGTYRLRFEKEGFVLFEREIEVRAGQPAPTPSVALAPAEPTAAAPPPPEAPKAAPLPAPGKAITVNVPDFLERNLITNSQPQKVSALSCSGLGNTVLWQVREPWDNRRHEAADAMLYIVAGEGTLRLGTADVGVQAGSFTQIPRGTTYSVRRRGRNPVIILATLVGEPCQ